jgi:adenylate cyclase
MNRRLAAILAADIVGFSRLMGQAEELTLMRLKELRQRITDPSILHHRGRIFKTTGDGLLAEFGSALDAVRCAEDIQRNMPNFNSEAASERHVALRIGVHIGDVLIDGDDIFGEGVNIAARLESIAEPSGICISDDVHRQVWKNTPVSFSDMGPQVLKNISEPIRAWRATIDYQKDENATESNTISGVKETSIERPSIAVMPFNNMSNDPEQEFFVDGLTEDIITELSRIRGLLVIARNSTFTYKGTAIDVKKVASQLNVAYVLEGSVRRSGNRLRITAQLIEASRGTHVWAERYDREMSDIFNLQDDMTQSIVSTLQTEMTLLEGSLAERSAPPSMQLWSKTKTIWRLFYSLTEPNLLKARELAHEMMVLSPEHPEGHRLFSLVTCHYVFMGFSKEPDTMTAEAVAAIETALRIKEDDEHTQWGIGVVNSFLGSNYARAESAYKRAIEINPNFSLGYGSYGSMLAYAGRADESIQTTAYAIRLNPKDPSMFLRYSTLSVAQFLKGNYPEARKWARASVERKPEWWAAHALLMASLALLGEEQEARAACREFVVRFPAISASSLPMRPIRPREAEAVFQRALSKAGLPQ